MFVLAWVVRTSRLAEYGPNGPSRGSEDLTAKGQDPEKQWTQLELYDRVIGFYHESNFWKLERDIGKDLLWARIAIGTALIIDGILLIVYRNVTEKEYILFLGLLVPSDFAVAIMVLVNLLIVGALMRYIRKFSKRTEPFFNKDREKYGNLSKFFGRNTEFYRYILFREKLRCINIGAEDIEAIIVLANYEKRVWADYVKTKPLYIWVYTFLAAFFAAILGGIVVTLAADGLDALVTNSFFNLMVGFVIICGFWLVLFPSFGVNTEQQRRYELPRFLAWYKADSTELTAPRPDNAKTPLA